MRTAGTNPGIFPPRVSFARVLSYWLGIGSSFTNLNPELIVNKSEPENEPSGQLFYHVNFVKFSAHRGDRVYSKRGPGAVPGRGMS